MINPDQPEALQKLGHKCVPLLFLEVLILGLMLPWSAVPRQCYPVSLVSKRLYVVAVSLHDLQQVACRQRHALHIRTG